jgi:hypothetical protein
MSTVILDTITGKSTATTITIGSTPVVSASANSMTIRGEGSNQTSIQQGLAKMWVHFDGNTGNDIRDSFNISSVADNDTGRYTYTYSNNMNNYYYQFTHNCGGASGTTGDEQYGSTGATNSSTGITTSTFYARNRRYDGNIYDVDIDSIMLHGDLA